MNPKPRHVGVNRAFGLAALTMMAAASVQAVDRFWTDGTSSYNNAAFWGGTVPNGGDNAIVNNGGTVLINPGDPAWTTFDIRAGQGGGDGAYIQNGPTVTLNSWFRMGVDVGTTGTYTLNSGILNADPDMHVGELGTGILNINGGTINHGGADAIIIGDRGGSATTLGTVNQVAGTLNSSSEIWVGQGGALGGSQAGTYNLSGTGAINVNNWLAVGRANANGVFNMTNGTIVKNGGGNIIVGSLAGNGTFNQYGGTVINTNTGTWLGEGGGGVGTWNLFGGTDNFSLILLSSANGGSGDGIINLSGTGLLIATEIRTNGIGNSLFTFNGGTLQAGADNATFMHDLVTASILGGGANIDSASHTITISQTLSDGGGGGGVTKLGLGTVTLTGPNTYVGPTIVKAGKLIAGTASLVTSAVVVSNSAGYGVATGTTNGQVSPSSVTLAGPANTLDFVLGGFGNPTLAPINVTGGLVANGTTTVNISDALPQVGQFPLVKYGSKTGAGTFVLGTLPVGVTAALVTNTGSSSIDLNITSTALIRWDGQVAGGVWDINTTTNWTDFVTTLPAKYTEGAAVYFDDQARGTTTVNLGVTVNPGTIILTNDALPYTLNGAGKISGTTGLTKQGTNSFTIANTTGNTYTGPTTVSGGTLNIVSLADGGLPSAIGSSSSSSANLVLNGGTLSYSGPTVTVDRGYSITAGSTLDVESDLTINGVVNPSINANFAKSGPATLSYKRAGANTYSRGGGGGAYDILGGGVVFDGSAGSQTNIITGELWVGGSTNSGGKLVVTNTTLNIASWLAIARGSGTSGYTSTASIYNSTLTSGNLSLAFDNGVPDTLQTGILALKGTTTYTNSGVSNVGESAGGEAIFTLEDSSVCYGNNQFFVGWHNNATGALTIANSAKVVVNSWMSIGNEAGVGSVLVKDNGTLSLPSQGDLNICDVNTGIGDLTITNNAIVKANNLFVGKGAGSTGTLNQWGGMVSGQNGGGIYVEIGSQAGALGAYNLNAGTLLARMIQSVNPGANSTFNFNGGLLVASYDGGQGVNGNFLNNLTTAYVLLGGARMDSGTNNITVTQSLLGDFNGDGGLTKFGTGALYLNGANTYTNTTLVTAGSLGGVGSITGPVVVQANATLAPGVGVGTLTINNNLGLAGNVAVDVDKSASPSNDLVVVTGTLVNTGTGSVKVTNLGPPLVPGDSFTLFNKPVVNGNLLSVPPSAGAVWTNKLAIDGSIQVVSLVPPPRFAAGGVSRLPSGNISLTATGIVGGAYTLWASTNVTLTPIPTTWVNLGSGTITASPFTIVDLTATNYPARFYLFSAP